MTKEELKKEAIQYAVDYPTSYGKGYKRKDLRIAYLAGAESREKRIAELKAQIEKMKNELHQRITSQYNCDSDLLDKIVGLDRLWQFGQEF